MVLARIHWNSCLTSTVAHNGDLGRGFCGALIAEDERFSPVEEEFNAGGESLGIYKGIHLGRLSNKTFLLLCIYWSS